jgi:hypothetical protein
MGNHRSGHRLTILDRETLKPLLYGTDDVFWRSFIEIRDGFIYAITIENGRYFLGKYDQNLKIVARSNEWVNENTFITFFDEFIYINSRTSRSWSLKGGSVTGGYNKTMSQFSLMMISTRRFFWRPSFVELSEMGRSGPKPR